MRRAFIGLSTPIGYDYVNSAPKAIADTFSSPNPVLDSPFGLLLLFDELVFLTRSLCPANMRELPYVKFLDEQGRVPALTVSEIELAEADAWARSLEASMDMRPFREVVESVPLLADMGVDNHSHGLQVGIIQRQANASSSNLAIDMLVCSKLNDPSIELIANCRFQPAVEGRHYGANHPRLAELLTIEGIPNYLSPQGPYHPVIDEVRENSYISDFRNWIASRPKNASWSEISEMRRDVEAALQDAQETIFLKHLEPKRHFESIGKAMIGDALGVLFPLSGTVGAVMEATVDAASDKAQYWQGFVVGARRTTRRIGK